MKTCATLEKAMITAALSMSQERSNHVYLGQEFKTVLITHLILGNTRLLKVTINLFSFNQVPLRSLKIIKLKNDIVSQSSYTVW